MNSDDLKRERHNNCERFFGGAPGRLPCLPDEPQCLPCALARIEELERGRKDDFDTIAEERNAYYAVVEQLQGHREELAEGREHLTVSGKFQSDKYPWAASGFLPLKIGDSLATDLLHTYANRRERIDSEFARDLRAALGAAQEGEDG